MSHSSCKNNFLASLLGLYMFCGCLSILVVSVDIKTEMLGYKRSDKDIEQDVEDLLAQNENCCNLNYFAALNRAIDYSVDRSKSDLEARVGEKLRSTFLRCNFEEATRESVAKLKPEEMAKVRQLVDSIQANMRARPETETEPSSEWNKCKKESLVGGILTFMDQRDAFGRSKLLTKSGFKGKFEELVDRPCSAVHEQLDNSAAVVGLYLNEDLVEGMDEETLYWARASRLCLRVRLYEKNAFEAYQAGALEAGSGQKCANSRFGRLFCLDSEH